MQSAKKATSTEKQIAEKVNLRHMEKGDLGAKLDVPREYNATLYEVYEAVKKSKIMQDL